jgi:hypothetical protein
VQPALVGGVAMGVLSALPLVGAGNLCCCLWVVSGGVIAAYLLQQNHPEPISPGDGALVGLLAGLIGALVQMVVSIPIDILVGPYQRQMVQRLMEMAGTVPPEIRDVFERYNRDAPSAIAFLVIGKIVGLFFGLVVGGIFATLGGLIGAALFKRTSPPGTIDVTPSGPIS